MSNLRMFMTASVLAIGLFACGKDGNTVPNPYAQQNCVNGVCTPIQNNCVNGVCNNVAPNQIQCAAGSIRLRNQCFQNQSLEQACMTTGGMMVNSNQGGLCRSERTLGGLNEQIVGIGSWTKVYPLSLPGMRPGETLAIIGKVKPRKSSNEWQVLLNMGNPMSPQSAAVIGSAQSGNIVTDLDTNVLMSTQVQSMSNGYYNNTAAYNPMMMQPIATYFVTLSARGTASIRLSAKAVGCERGDGNLYPCQ